MKILFISDIVGQPGRETVASRLPELKKKENADFVIANAENSAGGKGITVSIANELLNRGVDVITLGNHTFDRHEAEGALSLDRVLRPANYPSIVPGAGSGVFTTAGGIKIAVMSLMGRVYMPLTDCPFVKANLLLENILKETKNIVVDFHAEITSEKQAMGWFLDGRVSAVLGTHTHIPTADERILPQGTAYISDCGLTGPCEGVIGMDKELVLKRYLTGIPHHFEVAKGRLVMQGCVVDIDQSSGKAIGIKRFSI